VHNTRRNKAREPYDVTFDVKVKCIRSDYFFFRRFAVFAFFAAFLFFAISVLLATLCGDLGTVPPRIDVHCNSNTPRR
jgi:hypothetical protein